LAVTRAARALIIAALAGGLLSAIVYTSLVRLGVTGYPDDGSPSALLVWSVVATLALAVGLLAVSPIWWLFHRLRLRQWQTAALLGASLPLALLTGLLALGQATHPTPDRTPLVEWIVIYANFCVLGAVVGLVVWWVAYPANRPTTPPWAARWALAGLGLSLAISVVWSFVYASQTPLGP
jgi:hypothetical protein